MAGQGRVSIWLRWSCSRETLEIFWDKILIEIAGRRIRPLNSL
jgi:hypothetical protein